MPSRFALSHRDIYGLKYKPPSALSRFVASAFRDLIGLLALALCILVPVFAAALFY